MEASSSIHSPDHSSEQLTSEFYDLSLVAKEAPYGNDFTPTQDVRLRSGRLVYYASPEGINRRHLNESGSPAVQSPNHHRQPEAYQLHSSLGFDQTALQTEMPMPMQFDNFTGIVPPYANTNGHHYLPKLNGAPGLNSNGASTGGQKQAGALPAIPTSPTDKADPNGDALMMGGLSVKHLLTRNGNLSAVEEEELVKELVYLLPFIEERRLNAVKTEIADYDPHQRKIIDASAMQRIFMMNFKQVPLQVQQKMYRLFATDPKRPRLISYDDLMEFLLKLKSFADDNCGLLQKEAPPPATGSMSQSPFYKRGDAKLILEMELAMKDYNIPKVDVEAIRQAMNVLDRQHTGTLSESEIEDVLKSFGLLEVFKEPMRNLLNRCDMNGEKRYDWATLVRFFEKAQPVLNDEPVATKPKKDYMESELGFPMIAKMGGGGGAASQRAKPPKTHFQTLQEMHNVEDSRARVQDTAREMKALELERKKIEEAMARADKPHPQHKSKDQSNMGNNNAAELPAIFRQRAVTLDDAQNVVSISSKGAAAVSKRPRSAEKLIEELRKLDTQNYGYIPLALARTKIQQYNDLHQLGLNSRFINSAISICANATETHVNVRELVNYLNAVLTGNAGTP